MLQYPIKTSLKVLKKSKFSFVYAFFMGFTFILLFSSNSGGFDSDRTGSPNSGGATCASCHVGGTGGGSVVLTNAPTTYAYNMTYNMTLTVADADMQRAGFQITAVDALKTTFPKGSMTGAPKISAMKIIEELEETKRGLYSGAVGYSTKNFMNRSRSCRK